MKRKLLFVLCLLALVPSILLNAAAADRVFSGPQPGEKTTPLKLLELMGPAEGKERDPITENAGAATTLVFVHTIERSLVPLLRCHRRIAVRSAKTG
jgi:hypothetical protein